MQINFSRTSGPLRYLLVLICLGLPFSRSSAQCSSEIVTYPYTEDFESGPAWSSGGTNSDWAWGTPSHFFITSAGGGSKCWSIGGLSGSFYNYSEQSWLMSPCFDFSSLQYPWISFKIFWETEWKFDGMVLQYSIDGGSSWVNVGAYGDPVDCLNENWYNNNNISWLTSASPKNGWTGRIGLTSGSCQGGHGSTEWVTAKHCLTGLGGQSNVRFRFLFGSGTTCNDFDGIAIDDILIQEAPAVVPAYTASCTGTTVSFTNTSSGCPNNFHWDFGDPGSGAANISTLENPSHTFSGPGTYAITFTASSSCGAPGTTVQNYSLLDANVAGINVSCNGANDGSAAVSVVGGSAAYTYQWNTTPVQTTASIMGLSPGTYSVTVNSAGSCPGTGSVTITEPAPLEATVTATPSCTDLCNGSVAVTTAGGTTPYTHNWSGLGTGNDFNSVCVGAYTVTTTDAHGCTDTDTARVEAYPSPVLSCNALVICTGSSGFLQASGADVYTWSPATGLSATTGSTVEASPAVTTAYVLTGTSAEGCSSSMDILVTVDPTTAPVAGFEWMPQIPDVFDPQVQFTSTSTGAVSYYWNFINGDSSHTANPVYAFPADSGGNYTVCLTVENAVGCSDTICRQLTVQGSLTLYVPNSFTPDGDGMNDYFFPVIRDEDLDEVTWTIFNRWGQVVFETNNVHTSWDGTHHGIRSPEDVYVWKIRYMDKTTGARQERTGQVTLLR